MLPNFLIVGPPRAGSTWLYHAVAEHPDVFMAPEKEVCFFQYPAFDRGMEWYERFFHGWAGERRVGEASPNYLYFPESRDLIQRHLPHADIVACLRNPVDRLISHFWHRYNRGDWAPDTDPLAVLADPPDAIAAPGFYAHLLEGFLDRFPIEQVHVLFFDDLVDRPQAFLADVYERLGVDGTFTPGNALGRVNEAAGVLPARGARRFLYQRATTSLRSINRFLLNRFPPSVVTRLRQRLRPGRLVNRLLGPPPTRRVPPEVRQRLCDLYREDVRHLESMVSRDLSHWLMPVAPQPRESSERLEPDGRPSSTTSPPSAGHLP